MWLILRIGYSIIVKPENYWIVSLMRKPYSKARLWLYYKTTYQIGAWSWRLTVRPFAIWISGAVVHSDAVVYGNRGTNGIDWTISQPLVWVRLENRLFCWQAIYRSFFNDMNGLAMGKTHGLNLTIVVNINDGGVFFEYLPQKGRPILITCSVQSKALIIVG